MTEKLFKELFSFLKDCAKIEVMSTAGRINLVGMVLSLILAVVLSLGPILEAIVRLIRPHASVGVSVLEVFVAFCLFTIVCSGMLGYLERGPARDDGKNAAGRQPSSKTQHSGPDAASRTR